MLNFTHLVSIVSILLEKILSVFNISKKLFFIGIERSENLTDCCFADLDDAGMARMHSCRIFTIHLIKYNVFFSKETSIGKIANHLFASMIVLLGNHYFSLYQKVE